jgi:HK97 family phage portal protein
MNTEVVCTPGSDAFEVRNEATSGNTSPAAWFYDWASGGGRSDSGMSVNGYTALTHCALWQGVNVIAGDVGQTPVRLLRNEFDEQRTHPAWKLLRLRPNALQTPIIYTETIIQWALIWGNGVSWIIRKGSRPDELIPLRPDCLWTELVAFDEGQVLLYHYYSPTTGRQFVFFPDEVCHIQGLTGDGVWGYPLHQIGKNTIGHGLALEKHGNMSFSNGARPSGVLKHKEKLSPEARANLREEWNAIHGGAQNSGKIAILQEAMEFQAMAMTNIDAQWLEAKKANVYEAAAYSTSRPISSAPCRTRRSVRTSRSRIPTTPSAR